MALGALSQEHKIEGVIGSLELGKHKVWSQWRLK